MKSDTPPQSLLDRTLALAAMFKFLHAIRSIAEQGDVDRQTLSTAIHSLLAIRSDTMQAVFGDRSAVYDGLRVLKNLLLNHIEQRQIHLMRDAVIMLHLERKISNSPQLLEQISKGIEQAQQKANYFESTHESVITCLAELYEQTISPLSPRIIIRGEQIYLTNPSHIKVIRTLLLATLRCAVGWRQKGGSRWQILFRKKALLAATNHLLLAN